LIDAVKSGTLITVKFLSLKIHKLPRNLIIF